MPKGRAAKCARVHNRAIAAGNPTRGNCFANGNTKRGRKVGKVVRGDQHVNKKTKNIVHGDKTYVCSLACQMIDGEWHITLNDIVRYADLYASYDYKALDRDSDEAQFIAKKLLVTLQVEAAQKDDNSHKCPSGMGGRGMGRKYGGRVPN
jgi:hypothetical protein